MTASNTVTLTGNVEPRHGLLGATLGAIAVFMLFVPLFASRLVLASADPHSFGEAFDGIFDTRALSIALGTACLLLGILACLSPSHFPKHWLRIVSLIAAVALGGAILLQARTWTHQFQRSTILVREVTGTTVFYDGFRTQTGSIVGFREPMPAATAPGRLPPTVHTFSPAHLLHRAEPEEIVIAGNVLAEVRYGSFKNNRFAWHILASACASAIAGTCLMFLLPGVFSDRAAARVRGSSIIGLVACTFWLISTLRF
jgi:hypothetical protein